MSVTRATVVLTKDYCRERGLPYYEFTVPRPLELKERDVHGGVTRFKCGLAHAFICAVSDARVFGPGYVVTGDGRCLLNGMSHGNYPQFLDGQLQSYQVGRIANSVIELRIPDAAPVPVDEAVLLWGSENFGHWFFTYLHRLTLLSELPQLRDMKLLVLDRTPERFISWLARMGIGEERLVRGQDGARIARLWLPSVLHYRGHYDDMDTYTYPDAVHRFRERILRERAAPLPPGEKRERIYISRARAKWRRAVNEEELVARLKSLGVRRVFFEDLSVDEQIDVVSRTELIVMLAGAASPITMLAPRDSSIIELCLPGASGIFGSRLWAQILGQRFSRLDLTPVAASGNQQIHQTTDLDGIVPVDEVAKLIEAADANRD